MDTGKLSRLLDILRKFPRYRSLRCLFEQPALTQARQRASAELQHQDWAGERYTIHQRLKKRARTLDLIERQRRELNNPKIGCFIEQQILEAELQDLARATLRDEQACENLPPKDRS
ncbi:MAG: hypothetical protein U0Q18_10575 [Bryobacteraceae bacterium]